jgi:NTE family protein
VVADAHQGHGVGPQLLQALIASAREQGLHRLHAYVLRDNVAMLRMLRRARIAVQDDPDDSSLVLALAPNLPMALLRTSHHGRVATLVGRLEGLVGQLDCAQRKGSNMKTALVTGSAPVRLALVCGSGGVKSVAALGVAQVLEEAGIRPDLVVGCSGGAIFGAVVAAGYPAAQAQDMALKLWSREITSQRRRRAWLDMALGPLSAAHARGFGDSFGLRDDSLICERMHIAFGELRMEALPTPLLINATDAASGEQVLLSQGRLCDALRASIALPFLFAPHRVDGRLLIDGSVSDPLPVSAAAQAQVVLAIGFEVPTPRHVTGPVRLATRVTAALSNNLLQARLAAHAGPTRIVLMPRPDRRVGLFEAEAMPYLVELGRQAARGCLPQLQALLQQPAAGDKVMALRAA